MDYEYFRIEESERFSFFRIPKALFTDKEFEVLSTDAKLLYGILLDRISLSKKNGWVDMDGYVYIIYTIAELKALLHMSHATVIKLLHELDTEHGIGLIERYQRGCNRPAIIYVKNFVKPYQTVESAYEVSGIQNNRTPAFKNIEARTSKKLKAGIQKTRSPDFKNIYPSNTDINKTEKNKTDKSKKASRKKENTRLYGRFKNIKLSEEEYLELCELFPDIYQKMIDQLSVYMKSSGKTYQDHFATLLLWGEREGKSIGGGRYDFQEGECL